MEKKLKIGILYSKESKTTPYQQWAEEVFDADVQLINSRSEIINTNIDVLVLVGGADVYPARYGQKPGMKTGVPNMDLEWFDQVVLPKYIQRALEKKLVIFGICRGFQTLNVLFGGSLSQDIPQGYSGKSRDELVEDVIINIQKGEYEKFNITTVSSAGKVTLATQIRVNSLHHQGFYDSQIAKDFIVIGKNKTYNNIEIMAHKTGLIAAVQYHPKFFGA